MAIFNISPRSQKDAIRIAMSKKIIKINKTPLINLYKNKKLSIMEIAEILRRDPEIIRRELIRNKIPLRTKSEAIRLGWYRQRTPKADIKALYYDSNLTQGQIAKKLGKSTGHISLLMGEYKLKTRGPSQTLLKYPKYNFSGNLLEKAYLLGFRAGDLHVKLSPSKKFIRVDCTSTKNEQILLFKQLFDKYGFIWISKLRADGNRVFLVRLNRTFDFLLPKKDSIPQWILVNEKYFFAYLAGYTDAEGCIHIFKNMARVTLASYDKTILKQIFGSLNKFGIPCNPPRILVKEGHIKSGGLIYRKNHWSLTIAKKSSVFLLLQAIEPYLKHGKRVNDLRIAKDNVIKRNMKLLSADKGLQILTSI